ncbi:polysaccharide biosynthesis/export family protein [Roseomonas harenae]|uniref:polysaccharide biosynthesis/export family protein n=1 Tax=Muricoccus harenae TaxID=2692566 RepID=UPI001331835F|nr:polysaccharide biosynthesis/export family protein [Roseomonas harenae]
MSASPSHSGLAKRRPRLHRGVFRAVPLLLMLAGCAAPGSDLPVLAEESVGPYRLGPGDQVRITVFNDPRLTGEFRVNDTGTLALPLVGSEPALGRTTQETERSIEASMLKRGLFTEPQVAVEVVTYRPIFVLGMVERGGQTPYQPGMTVLSAVAVAGGFNYRAVTDYVALTRIGQDGRAQEYRAGRNALLRPGDVVNVFERRF